MGTSCKDTGNANRSDNLGGANRCTAKNLMMKCSGTDLLDNLFEIGGT